MARGRRYGARIEAWGIERVEVLEHRSVKPMLHDRIRRPADAVTQCSDRQRKKH
jgi:hypothetical protein